MCDKKFLHKSKYNQHLKYYGRTSFSCNSCDKTFKRQDHSRNHFENFSGLMPTMVNMEIKQNVHAVF